MAIIINPEISGQEFSSDITYCYLYEPLRINIKESNTLATKLFVEVKRYGIEDKNALIPFSDGSLSLPSYVEIDLIPGKSVTFDLGEVMQQLHQANVYKVATIGDIETSNETMVISKFIYSFSITTDVTTIPVVVKKLPIIGARNFQSFTGTVSKGQVLDEFDYYGVNKSELVKKWANYRFYNTALKDPLVDSNLRPTISLLPQVGSMYPEGGVLYWKSKFGGWMFWGFDIENRNESHSYSGELESGLFESTKRVNGNPFIPVDYLAIETSYTVELRSLGLKQNELLAVSGINSSPAIYYARDNSGRLELMRLTSSSSPYKNLAKGGDFTVSLKSISKHTQKAA